MKVTPLNTINFTNNKRLNNKLVRKLEQSPYSPINDAIYQINESCNVVEDKIRKLEGADLSKVDKNEDQINMLLDYFIDAKAYLCQRVNELFPDLNYLKTECDTYDKEASSREIPPEADEGGNLRSVYTWREQLVDGLITLDESLNQNKYIDEDSYLSSKPLVSKSVNASGDTQESLIEKFTPLKYSPQSLDDVVGLKDAIEDVNELIVFPLEHPRLAKKRKQEYGIEIPRFIMFYGPPGCGKTMIAEAISAQTGCDMYKMDISKIGSQYINQTAINITNAFEELRDISKSGKKPTLLFMDEVDSMLTKREGGLNSDSEDNKTVNTLLQHLNSVQDSNIIVIGATNMYDLIDPAVKDRAELELYIGLPNDDEREEIIRRILSNYSASATLSNNDIQMKKLSRELRPYSPRTIKKMAKIAPRSAYREKREVELKDFLEVIKKGNYEKIKEEDYKPKNKKSLGSMGFSDSL